MQRLVAWLERLSTRQWLVLLVLVALAGRLAWAGAMSYREPWADEAAYLEHARELCAGQGYVDWAGRPTSYFPVGYPLVLAAALCLSGGHPLTGIALQILFGILACLLVCRIGVRTTGPAVARVAALAMAVYPTHVFYSTLMLHDPLATALFLGACLCLLTSLPFGRASAFAAGGLLGYAVLTRPMLGLMPAAVPVWFLIHTGIRRAAVLSCLFLAGALTVLAPWIVRNHLLFGRGFEISSTGAYNFLIGNHSRALGGSWRPRELWSDTMTRAVPDAAKDGYQRGWIAIREAPLTAMRRSIQKVSYLVALETDGVLYNLKRQRFAVRLSVAVPLLLVANVAYVGLVCGCLLGLLGPFPHPPFKALFLLLALSLTLVAMVFLGDPRYHYPLVPLAAVPFAKAVYVDWPALRDGLQRGDRAAARRFRTWMALNATFAALLLGNLWLKYLERVRFAE